jgi:hypothetical protein
MAKSSSLTVRNLSPATMTHLAGRAKAKGRSLDAEVRAILNAAAKEEPSMQSVFPDWFLAMIEPGEGEVREFLEGRRQPHNAMEL